MPKFDGTGPSRMGPGTGRGYGPCMGTFQYGRGRGRGRGMGMRRGFGFWECPYFHCGGFQDEKEYKKYLQDHVKELESELGIVKRELTELESN